MNAVGDALAQAGKYHLETEVVYFALDSMKGNPRQGIADAIYSGLEEWVK